ncbi:MAG: DUF2834 domain-containing protein [Cyanobacteria bacterium P01_H01_bin.58]
MKTKHTYLLLALIGIVLPYSQLIPWIVDNGLNISLLLQQIIESRIAAFGWLDVIVSALVLFVLIATEGRNRGVSILWLPVFGTLTVGVSLGFPLYLYLREISIEST